MTCVKTRRLFLALWPACDLRNSLTTALTTLPLPVGVRRVSSADWHITLAYLGTVPEAARPDIETLLTEFPGQPEPLVLDTMEWWPEAGVGVWAASHVPPALLVAQAQLSVRLHALGLRVDTRPWRPHLTFARAMNGPIDGNPPTPLAWRIRYLALVESHLTVGSGSYSVIATHEVI
jgi:2'-5' RNA ligase